MRVGDPVTVILTRNGPMFRQYEIVKVANGPIYNMVREDATLDAAGSCIVSLRRLNTHKWKWVAKIQIRIFKHLLQEPKIDQPMKQFK